MSPGTMVENIPPEILAQLPASDICSSILALAAKNLAPAILNHSLRVFLHAQNRLAHESASNTTPSTFFARDPIDVTLLFIAALCHDLGTSKLYNGVERFEVEGADAACAHMRAHGLTSEVDLQRVWSAIALHTSTGIAERIDPLTRLVRVAVKIDFSADTQRQYEATAYAQELERSLPRLEVEKVLGDAVVAQAEEIIDNDIRVDASTWPDFRKFPKASWPGILLRAHLENNGYEGINPAF